MRKTTRRTFVEVTTAVCRQGCRCPDSPQICDSLIVVTSCETKMAQKRGFVGVKVFHREHALAYHIPQSKEVMKP